MSKIHLLLRPTALLVFLLASLLSQAGRAQNIQLDPTFGVGGKVTVGFSDTGLRSSHAFHLFLQPTGRIVVLGGHRSGGQLGTSGIAACGLTQSGILDTGFGAVGKTLEMNNSDVYAIDPLSNGQFLRLIADWSTPPFVLSGLKRLNSNGSVDSSFVADLNVGANSVPVGLTTRSDGKILLLLRGIGGDASHWLVQLNANGSRDSSFGTNGIRLLNLRRPSSFAAVGLHIRSDNRILIGGYLSTSSAPSGGNIAWAVLLDESGNYDRRFGLQGVARVPFVGGVRISQTLLQPDGKILLIGRAYNATNSRFLIMRLTTRGRLDAGFGQNGIAIAPNVTQDSFEGAYSAALMSDGKIAVVGTYAATQTSVADFLVARFAPNGLRESYTRTQFTQDQNSFANDVAIQPDGKLVVAGYTWNPDASADGNLFAIARYTQ